MKFCFEKKDFIQHEIEKDKVAIIAENNVLTWNEFENRVNQVCQFFEQNHLSKSKFPVLLYGHKQAEMIVVVYAMIKLQIPYVPIDIIYSSDRVESIIKHSKSQILINCSGFDVNFSCGSIINYSNFHLSFSKKQPIEIEELKPIDPLIYIIFTSGSTGEPKGVQISTEAVQDFTRWMCEDFGFSSKDVFINIAVLSFDLSVYELMTFAVLGATIILNSKETTENPDILLDKIQEHKGSVWISTPSFAFIYSRLNDTSKLDSIRYFLFCGELLPHNLAKKLVENFPKAVVYNTYGPTEATVATTQIKIDESILNSYDVLPVGKSKPRSHIEIEKDEIIIVGPNVSKGYLNRPDLNETKFIERNGQRAFKTGDLGYLENEMLFFKGRNDDQVKLHGFRIELNEITTQINELDYVLLAETIPLKRNGEVKKIVSLAKLKPNVSANVDWKTKIMGDLKNILPYYMIPSDIKIIDEIPLNQNGKTDKRMLEKIYLG